MTGLNQRLRTSSGKVTLSKAFAEEHGPVFAASSYGQRANSAYIVWRDRTWHYQLGEELANYIAKHDLAVGSVHNAPLSVRHTPTCAVKFQGSGLQVIRKMVLEH